MYNYDRIVFAYQETRKSNHAPSNDSNIYSSIASLIKAQAYEIASLKDGRKKDEKYVYNINLISVADIDLYELHYDKNSVSTLSIDRINYLNRFLISSQEQHSKIDFVKVDILEKVIEEYNTLHDWNVNFYKTINKEFYNDVFTDYGKRTLIVDKTKSNFLWYVKNYTSNTLSNIDFNFLFLDQNDENVLINVSDSSEVNKILNSNRKLHHHTSEWLKNNFKYSGKFIFTEDLLPF